jgi:GDP-mannose 6-dehydrogenase
MNISVFGLGYVGLVTAACFSEEGHNIVGVDVSKDKVELLNTGICPIIEEKLPAMITNHVTSQRLKATTDAAVAVAATDLAIICVGTPSLPGGELNQQYVLQVTKDICHCLKENPKPFTLVFRSTIIPGTIRNLILPVIESILGDLDKQTIDLLFHPEFLREGSSVYDFYHPPKIVIGEIKKDSSEKLLSLYPEKFKCPKIVCSVETAEMVKYCDNMFHAIKITFANEVGQYCKTMDINAIEVMEIFCQDRKLNISDKYLRPGFAFGGSCLPKDLRAFSAESGKQKVRLPMIESVLQSNQIQIDNMSNELLDSSSTTFGFYGLSFKPGTDDLRESPYVILAERLVSHGHQVKIYDPLVHESKLIGKNKSYVDLHLPHLSSLLVTDPEKLLDCQTIICAHKPDKNFEEHALNSGKKIKILY